MNTHLVFVHGRAQEGKDGHALKREWISTFERGLAKSGLQLPIPESQIHFPYFGDTLHDLTKNLPEDQAARVTVMGAREDTSRQEFLAAVLQDVQQARGLSDSQVREAMASTHIVQGPLQWEWVQGILAAIDRYLPGASAASVALATNDVFHYLRDGRTAGVINKGVQSAMQAGVRQVVVSHSLGTLVAYNVLCNSASAGQWNVPLFVTLGSPLAVTAISQSLTPLKYPPAVGGWFNAMDGRDVVALYPLKTPYFNMAPPIENKVDVQNHTENHHGISGYLDDQEVARRIHAALTAQAG